MAQWHYYDENGNKIGPFRGRELKELAQQGKIAPGTRVEDENGQIALAKQVTGLTFSEATPPPSPAAKEPSSVVVPHSPAHSVPPASHNSTRTPEPNYFYIDENGYKHGPMTTERLQTLVERGTITPTSQMETDAGRRGLAGQIPGLQFDAIALPSTEPASNPSENASTVGDKKTWKNTMQEWGGAALTLVEKAARPAPVQKTSSPGEQLDNRPSKSSVQHGTATGCSDMGKTEHERIIRYFTIQGCFARFFISVNDDIYDQMVMDKINGLGLKHRAIEKIGLDTDQLKEIPPVFLHGYSFEEIEVRTPEENLSKAGLWGNFGLRQGVAPTYFRIGSDGRLRSSKYDATWLFFSSTQIYVYKYTLDMASNSMKEVILEYFYKDITNFATVFTSYSPPRRSGLAAYIEMQMSGCLGISKVRESNQFVIVVPGDVFACSISGVADAEKSVQAMKQLMREKKD